MSMKFSESNKFLFHAEKALYQIDGAVLDLDCFLRHQASSAYNSVQNSQTPNSSPTSFSSCTLFPGGYGLELI